MKKLIFFLFLPCMSLAQSTPPQGWHLLDQKTDGYYGISLKQAYEALKGRKSQTVVVAVIDSGIDTTQEDLKPILWTNPKEIPGNGVDDDHNGYVDDVHGWNFDGNAAGVNLDRNSHEVERVYHHWKAQFQNKTAAQIPAKDQFLYAQWIKSQTILKKDYDEAQQNLPNVEQLLKALENTSALLRQKLGTASFHLKDVKALENDKEERTSQSAKLWIDFFGRISQPDAASDEDILTEIRSYRDRMQKSITLMEQAPEDTRGELTKDKYEDINDRIYGNNNLTGGSGHHGTLVSGVIGAVRGNGLGVDGIADNVRIMGVRAVPGGDEHDKDVALAIRYAVDNGAQVINMSFGKPVSPYKSFVDDAVRYAASKGVLLVHGSGNDGADITKDVFYPNPVFLDGKRASNMITVGASSDGKDNGFVASFSNYSKTDVDVLAPGTAIYSTAPENQYESADGTSLASPVVAGVAALLKEYFPRLTPAQIIDILKRSGTSVNVKVTQPGTEDSQVNFVDLTSSGRIINAYNAVKLAMEMEKR